MKKLILVILVVVAVISSAAVFAADNDSAKVIAYYFHGSFRCYSCNLMENYTKEAIENNFAEEIKAGKIEFLAVNVEKKENEHFVQDYQLYTKSVILSLTKDGKEVKSKNLDKVWKLARDKQRFIDYVISEINGFMKDAQ